MIFPVIICLISIEVVYGFPQTLEASTPEEVNSLEREEPLGRSIDSHKSQNAVEKTVKEVEAILKTNPNLPRLTRGEILDLLENITITDQRKTKIVNKTRKSKAVMVVMPYTLTNGKNIEDLYTKAPVTHMEGGETFNADKRRRRPPAIHTVPSDNDIIIKDERKKYSASVTEKPSKITPSRKVIRRRRPISSTEVSPTTYRPISYRRRTTTKHPNHRYGDDFLPSATNGIRIIEPPNLKSATSNFHNLDTDLEVQDSVIQEVKSKPEIFNKTRSENETNLIEDIGLPINLKPLVQELNLKQAVSPVAQQLTANLEEQNRIKSMLISIGVLPSSTTTTTTTLVPNAESVIDAISPEMRELLMSFGLLPDPNEKKVSDSTDRYIPETAKISRDSYVGFKPLPDDGPSRNDMDALLASFGLGRSSRKHKSLKIEKNSQPNKYSFEMIPDNLKDIITNLGIDHIDSRKISSTTTERVIEKQHVFNPDMQYATEEELKKLDKLLNMIKQLEKLNGTVTDEDLAKIDVDSLKELVSSLNGQNDSIAVGLESLENSGPDPTVFDVDSLSIKNEIKREESTKAQLTSETTTIATKNIESETPSIKDLEASFGGQREEITLPPILAATTSASGFYYLLDWNTFLDIDDTKGKRVNLRFQPTVGDPNRFLSVR